MRFCVLHGGQSLELWVVEGWRVWPHLGAVRGMGECSDWGCTFGSGGLEV